MNAMKNNLIAQIAYLTAYRCFISGMKCKESFTNWKDSEKYFRKIYKECELVSMNEINDKTISEMPNEVLENYLKHSETDY